MLLFVQLAAAALIVIAAVFFFKPAGGDLARLTSSRDAVWGSQAVESGDWLGKGRYQLTYGYTELALNNGVRLILEAPVDLEIDSLNQVRLVRGQLVARVPRAAIGFTVLTPSSEVIDLGTEFGVSVDEAGASEVHVLDGEVKARPIQGGTFSNLLKNEGMSIDVNRQVTMIKSDPSRFRRALPGRSVDNPDYLHWSCDAGSDRLECHGTGINGTFYPGRLMALNNGEGPIFQNGQFGEALYFNGEDAYVETEFPGIGGSNPRTIVFWAKIPEDFSIHNGYGILGWGVMKDGAAWQISPNPTECEGPLGRLRVGTVSAPIIGTTDLRDNRWHHIAVVMYGGDEADLSTHVLLYVDGHLEMTSRKSIMKIQTALGDEESRPLMFGRNMAFKTDTTTIPDRFFKGWIDEVFIFNTALEQEKIKRLMQTNRLD